VLVQAIFSVLAGVLACGNLTFKDQGSAEQPHRVADASQLQLVAGLLGVSDRVLQERLTVRPARVEPALS
jgi:myosin heavy subunit